MVLNPNFSYPTLTTATQIRVLLLAPGRADEPIHCFHLVIDLDADWELPGVSQAPQPAPEHYHLSKIDAKDRNGTSFLSFTVPELRRRAAEDGGGLRPFQRYIALSYVWGDQNNPQEIFLNGHSFYVGHNLYTALRRLQNTMVIVKQDSDYEGTIDDETLRVLHHHVLPEGRLLWIDAMCIDQADILEREAQVKLMARIYSQADHVHADLGYPVSENGRKLLNLLQTIDKAGSACESRRSSPTQEPETFDNSALDSEMVSGVIKNWEIIESKSKWGLLPPPRVPKASDYVLEDYGLPPADDAIWVWWRQLINSTYFTRLWVVQEFALAKRVSIWFGNVGLDPNLIVKCLEYLFKYSTNRSYYLSADTTESSFDSTSAVGFSMLVELASQRMLIRNSTASGTGESHLLGKLTLSRGTQATDQRDKIYGMLGLASDGGNFFPLVSYSKSTCEVFRDFARRFIETGQGIEMLYQVDSSTSNTLGTPTWVPVSRPKT
jgi:hypothetical protein